VRAEKIAAGEENQRATGTRVARGKKERIVQRKLGVIYEADVVRAPRGFNESRVSLEVEVKAAEGERKTVRAYASMLQDVSVLGVSNW
jgi:hypothetical protein